MNIKNIMLALCILSNETYSSKSSPTASKEIAVAFGGIILGHYVGSLSKPYPNNETLHTLENKQSPESSLKPGQAGWITDDSNILHYHVPSPYERSLIQNAAKELNIDPTFDIASKVRIFHDSGYNGSCINLIDNTFIYIPQSKTSYTKPLKEALAHGISHYYLDDRSNNLVSAAPIIPAISAIPAIKNIWDNGENLNFASFWASLFMIHVALNPIINCYRFSSEISSFVKGKQEERAANNAKAFIANKEAFAFLVERQPTKKASLQQDASEPSTQNSSSDSSCS